MFKTSIAATVLALMACAEPPPKPHYQPMQMAQNLYVPDLPSLPIEDRGLQAAREMRETLEKIRDREIQQGILYELQWLNDGRGQMRQNDERFERSFR